MKLRLHEAVRFGDAAKGEVRTAQPGEVVDVANKAANRLINLGVASKATGESEGSAEASESGQSGGNEEGGG